jgi:hypothetical protein
MEVERSSITVKITDDNKSIESDSVEANLLFIILDNIEEIRRIASAFAALNQIKKHF